MAGKTLSYKLLVSVLCVALVGSMAPRVNAQDGFRDFLQSFLPDSILEAFNLDDPPPEEVLDNLLSEAEVLELEKPRSGFVVENGVDIYTLRIPTNGTEFPNLLLTLSVNNDGGDADLYCIPTFLFNESGIVPSRSFALWGSAHSQGNDYVFISREDRQYPSAMVGILEDGQSAEAVSFVCSIHGYSANGAEYTLELDIDFSDRSMVDSEQQAMQEIFEQCCGGDDWQCRKWKAETDENGDVSMDFCHMQGSICNGEGRLVRLDLRRHGLECEIPTAALAELKALEKLQLSKNKLTGNVGALLAGLAQEMPSLQHLDLSSNAMTGDFSFEEEGESPLCQLTHGAGLRFLNLEFNQISGRLPDCIFDSTSELREIFLEGNELNSEFPEISEESGIQLLHLANLGLKGALPASIGDLKSLVAIDVSGNKLEGTVPAALGSGSFLKNIRLQGNKFEGAVPEAIAESRSLRFVRLDRNAFTSLPQAWYGDSVASGKLGVVDASFNELEGEFPVALARASNLTYLNLHKNQLTGRLPEEEGVFPRLVVLNLGMNKFRGPLPEAFGNAGMFEEEVRSSSAYLPLFDLSDNKLTGKVPEFLYEQNVDKRLTREIYIGGNNFDLPCPLPVQLRYIKDLVCEDKVDADTREGKTVAVGPSPVPEEEASPAPAVEPAEEDADEPAIAPLVVPVISDDSEPDVEPSMPEPESDLDMDEEALEGVGFESVTGDVVEAPLFQGKGSSKDGEGTKDRDFDVSLATSAGGEEAASEKVFSSKAVGGVAVLGFLAILVIVVIAVVVVGRKKRAAREREIDQMLAVDVEMATPPATREGDTVHMLEGVKPSSGAME